MSRRAPLVALFASALTLIAACSGSSGMSDAAPARTPAPAGATESAQAGRAPAVAAGYADWPSYHGGRYRGGYASTMPAVSGAPRVLKNIRLDGQVYAAPIVVRGVTIVATENNTVYALSSSYHLLWKRHLGAPSQASQRPCGNISPLGITGTPVYEARYNSIYVAPEYSGNPPRHELVSLAFGSGAVKWHKSIDFPGVDQRVMQQRGALTVVGTRVWVPFGGMAGDCGNYKGRIVGLSRFSGSAPIRYTVPTSREAGIWTPPGIVTDSHGAMYVAVGNGAAGAGDRYDHSDSILKLSTSGKLLGFFAPSNWASENDNDVDLGSQGPAFVGPWIFSAGKSGTAYTLKPGALGGIGGQVSKASVCRSFGGTAVARGVVYVPCTDGVRAVSIDSAGRMHIRWRAASNITGSPVVGGGRIWSLDADAGVLHALSPTTGRSLGSANVGQTTRFATPAIYGHNLAVPTKTGVAIVAAS